MVPTPFKLQFALWCAPLLFLLVLDAHGWGQVSERRTNIDVPCNDVESAGVTHSSGVQPNVVPRMQTWAASGGEWVLTKESRIVLESRAASTGVRPFAEQLATELQTLTGITPPIIVGVKPAPHDIAFSLSMCNVAASQVAAAEGYTLFVGQFVSLRANGSAGLNYARTTLLQMLELRHELNAKKPTLAGGYSLDYPSFPVRSIMLDVGRLYMRKDFLADFLRFMSWYKLNTLELHLNDQAFGINPAGTAIDPENPRFYSRSMRLLSSRFPLAFPTDGTPGAKTSEGRKGYSHEDWEDLETVAHDNGVTLKPEIDVPAHSGVFLNAMPDLELRGVSAQWGGVFDLKKPQSLEYVNGIFDEFLPWFHSAAISIGGDEATPELTGLSDQTRATFLAGVVNHVLSKGDLNGQHRTVTMWNDAYAPNSPLTAQRDSIVIQDWLGKDDDYLNQGGFRNVLDSRSTWYLVPEKNDQSNEQLAKRIFDDWIVNPKSIGGQICEWNDNAALGLNESGVIVATKDVLPAAAQVLWSRKVSGGNGAPLSYSQIAAALPQLGYGPNVRRTFPRLSAPVSK